MEPLDIKTRRRMTAILRVLHDSPKPMGSQRIAETLLLSGIDLGERTVRNYLAQADDMGWTKNLGRRGRTLTSQGVQELQGALVVDKVGFVSTRVDSLSYQMDYDVEKHAGNVVLNISTVAPRDIRPSLSVLIGAFRAGMGMGELVGIAGPGQLLGAFRVPRDRIAIATVCSITINGIFCRGGIPTRSRFGGLLQLERGLPRRFTQIVTYDGSSLDPLEIFIRGHMTSVGEAADKGNGLVGASFREVPAEAISEVRRLTDLSENDGLGGVMAIGSPNQPLLDVPVSQGRVGLIVGGGLNPIAAMVEQGIPVTSEAMSTLCDVGALVRYTELETEAARIAV